METPKRYGIISNIHGNVEALNVAMEYFHNAKIDQILCLGNLIGNSSRPFASIDIIRKLPNVHCLLGEADRHLMRKFEQSRGSWTPAQESYLRRLPQSMTLGDDLLLVHASPESDAQPIETPEASKKNLKYMLAQYPGRRICFFGNTSFPILIGTLAVISNLEETKSYQLDSKDVYLINPGSLALDSSVVRNEYPGCRFGFFDAEKWTMTFVRKPPYKPISSTKRW